MDSVQRVDVSRVENFFAAAGDCHVTLWGFDFL